MPLRYLGDTPRDGWTVGEVREVDDDTAAPLIASGLWAVDQVAPRVPGPEHDRMMRPPEVRPWH